MSDASPADKWGVSGVDSSAADTSGPLQTIQSKFLDSVKQAADKKHLQLVVHSEGQGKGYGYIQRTSGFSNLYAFRFQFGEAAATFELGLGDPKRLPRRVEVPYSEGARMDEVLSEVRKGIDAAAKFAFPELGALTQSSSDEVETMDDDLAARASGVPTTRTRGPTDSEAGALWGQGRKQTGPQEVDPDLIKRRYKSHKVRNVTVIVLIIVLLVFVPLLTVNSASAGPSYRVSVTNHYLGIGGEYMPPGWTSHLSLGKQMGANGTVTYGFGVYGYYFEA